MASTTLAKYKTRILTSIGLTGDASAWDTILTDKLNEAYEDVLLKTRCNVELATLSFTAGEDSYQLSTPPLAILTFKTTSGGSEYLMEPVSLPAIRDMQRNGTITGSPVRYYAVSGNTIVVYPTPSAADTLAIDYVPRPTAMSEAAHTPSDIQPEFHQLLEWYVLAWIGMAEEHQASGNGTFWEAKYEKGLRDMKLALRMRKGIRGRRARVGRPRYAPSDPSVITY